MSTRLALLPLLLSACVSPITGLGVGGEKCTAEEHQHLDDLDLGDTGVAPTTGPVDELPADPQECSTFVSRDQEFWAHPDAACVLAGDATGSALLPLSVGSGGARLTLSTPAEVRRLLASDTTEPRVRLGQQILVAKLNLGAFPWIGGLALDDYGPFPVRVEAAEAVYDRGSDAARRAATNELAALNALGAAETLWFDPTCTAAPEVCNGADDDGDGAVDDGCACP